MVPSLDTGSSGVGSASRRAGIAGPSFVRPVETGSYVTRRECSPGTHDARIGDRPVADRAGDRRPLDGERGRPVRDSALVRLRRGGSALLPARGALGGGAEGPLRRSGGRGEL